MLLIIAIMMATRLIDALYLIEAFAQKGFDNTRPWQQCPSVPSAIEAVHSRLQMPLARSSRCLEIFLVSQAPVPHPHEPSLSAAGISLAHSTAVRGRSRPEAVWARTRTRVGSRTRGRVLSTWRSAGTSMELASLTPT